MASSMGRAGLTGSAGAQRAVRKGVDVARHSARGSSSRAAPSFVPKSLRSEDLALLKEAETYMSAEEHAELRRLLEENSKLRQVVTSNATHLSPQQLERFTKEYSNLAKEAEQAGVAVDASLKQQQVAAAAPAAAPARFSGVMAARTSPSQAAAESGASAIQANMGYSNRSYGVSVMVEDRPPSPPRPPAAKQPPPPPRVSAAPPPSFDFEVKSRDYARDMASLSVELDGTVDDDDDTDGLLTEVPVASTRVPTDGPHTTVSSRFEPLLSDRRPANINGVQADVADQLRQEAGVSQETERQKAVLRAAALAEVESHRPADVIKGREHWMIITVPEKPVAGAPMQLYFNRNQSEKLKSRPHIVLQYGFNSWELQPETGNRLDLAPAPVPKSDITDFWSCRMEVPEDTFEINFILHDNNGIFENNNNMDFTYTLEAGITYDQWIDTAAERLVQKELARKEAEAKAAAEAKQKAKELMHEQAKEFGRKKAEELQANYSKLQEGGTSALMKDGNPVFKVTPTKPAAGSTIRLAYNRKAGPFNRFDIPTGQHLTLLYGFNGWQNGGKAQMFRPATPPAGADPATEDWFECEVALPREAAAMNFVMNYYEHYDNNGSQDYKVAVQLPKGTTLETWAGELAEELRQRELERRLAAQALAEEKERKREIKKKLAQDQVKAVERRKVRHVLFTVPEVVQAGQEVTVFYNPHDTSLNGRQQIYLMGGWNRWTHKRHFGPIAMHPPSEGEEHWQATVTVPKDAYKMDFVFSDVPGGDGTYDNRGGFDYHLPVEGSPVREQPLYVAHIAVEMAPIAKVGGLGDVVTALGRAVKEQGHMVEVILPRYEFFAHSPLLNQAMQFETEFDWGGTRIVVTSAVVENLRCFFIEPRNGFFNTPTVYGRYDDEVRFDFFCKAALEFLLKTGRQPDILHCHDWSSAHVAQSYWQDYHAYGLYKPRVVFTIHNLNYGQKKIGEAAHACQKFTTVSPTYAFEVGGAPIIAPHAHKFMGIRNGIDPELWSPEENIFLPAPYSSENVVEGKKAARQALRQRLNLTSWNDKFIVAVVSRLTGQKGVPLIKHAAFRTIDRGGQFVLLGSAPDPKVQADFNALAQSMGGQDAAFQFKYDEPLSHLIYAAADMIVVPSMFEPCGLTQMIAMRYGTVPIVRHTGGLRDTVFDVDFDKERAAWELYGSSDWQRDEIDATNGFAFTGTDAGALDYAMNRAIDAWYNDRAWFHSLQQRVMEQDWSWNRPAIDYIELYFSALKS